MNLLAVRVSNEVLPGLFDYIHEFLFQFEPLNSSGLTRIMFKNGCQYRQC